jgi:hypothetical protein
MGLGYLTLSSPFVGCDQLGMADKMVLHRLLELRLGGVIQALKLGVERVQLEEVAMSADGWTRATVRLLPPIVGAVLCFAW